MFTPQQVAAFCRSLGGAARTAELRAGGASRHCLRLAVQAGAVERLREGLYAVPDITPAHRAARMHGGVLGCISAAAEAGLWVMPYAGVLSGSRRRGTNDATAAVTAFRTGASHPLFAANGPS